MKFKVLSALSILVPVLCAAPVLAQSHSGHSSTHNTAHLTLTPVACGDNDIGDEGPFTRFNQSHNSHFFSLTTGFTNPDGEFDDFVGGRIDGGTAGVAFANAGNWAITENTTGEFPDFCTVLATPSGLIFDTNVSTFNRNGNIVTATWNAVERGESGDKFIGIYAFNPDEDQSFIQTITAASVNGVVPIPNLHVPAMAGATNGFAIDCTGLFD